MFQLSKTLVRFMRKGRVPSKHGNKDYYKGTGGGSIGQHTKHGAYIIDPEKIRNWMIPDLTDFPLKAYVTHTCRPVVGAVKSVQEYIDTALRNK